MSGYDDLPHDAQVEIQRISDKWFAERDAYALRVAEAVREACELKLNARWNRCTPTPPPNSPDHEIAIGYAMRDLRTDIRALDLHAILKGVER